MAIFNAQTISTGGGSSDWKTATFTATSSTSTDVSSIAFTVTGQPKSWAVVCTNISGSYYTMTTTTSQYRTVGAYNDGSSVIGTELKGGTSAQFYRNTSAPTGSYSGSTFTVTAGTNRQFPMKRSSYYMTWTLFYTV